MTKTSLFRGQASNGPHTKLLVSWTSGFVDIIVKWMIFTVTLLAWRACSTRDVEPYNVESILHRCRRRWSYIGSKHALLKILCNSILHELEWTLSSS